MSEDYASHIFGFCFPIFQSGAGRYLKRLLHLFLLVTYVMKLGLHLRILGRLFKIQIPIQVELGYTEFLQHGFYAAAHFGDKTHENQT